MCTFILCEFCVGKTQVAGEEYVYWLPNHHHSSRAVFSRIQGCNQKFPDLSPEPKRQVVQLPAIRWHSITIFWVSLATITLCDASQRVFIFLCVKCDLQFSNGWNDKCVLSFASHSGKLHWKCMKCSKHISVTMTREEHRLLSGFFDSNVGKLWLKIVSIQVMPSQVAQRKTWRKHAKLSAKTNKLPFQRHLTY